MKVKVLQAFHDKFHFARIFDIGEVVDFEDTRAQDLIKRGLAESAAAVPGGQEGDKPPKDGDDTKDGGKGEEQPLKRSGETKGDTPAETKETGTEQPKDGVKADTKDADKKKASEKAAAEKIAKAKAKLNKRK